MLRSSVLRGSTRSSLQRSRKDWRHVELAVVAMPEFISRLVAEFRARRLETRKCLNPHFPDDILRCGMRFAQYP
jgi:hypothetical protein